jgi:hypothetical protein
MARCKQSRSDQTVRVSFETSRLSERVMAEVYERLVPVLQRRRPPDRDIPEPAAVTPDPICKFRR